MLKIPIPSATLSPNIFQQETLPTPPNGTETEVNGDLILLFEDEEEAVAYLDELEDYASEINEESEDRLSINALVSAINNDEFVQAYLQ